MNIAANEYEQHRWEDAKFMLEAGAYAQERWGVRDTVQIFQVKNAVSKATIPVFGLVSGSYCGQEEITLEKFTDGQHMIWMGYGSLSRTLAVRLP